MLFADGQIAQVDFSGRMQNEKGGMTYRTYETRSDRNGNRCRED